MSESRFKNWNGKIPFGERRQLLSVMLNRRQDAPGSSVIASPSCWRIVMTPTPPWMRTTRPYIRDSALGYADRPSRRRSCP